MEKHEKYHSFEIHFEFMFILKKPQISSPSVFIHSIIFVAIGSFGIICSLYLLSGLTTKKTGRIIGWICLQGILIFHQFFFMFEIITIAVNHFGFHGLTIILAIGLGTHFIIEFYFLAFIIKIYQEFIEIEAVQASPRPAWRIPTVSELLGDESQMGESIPPVLAIRNSRGASEA
jgi:hypothetical protein